MAIRNFYVKANIQGIKTSISGGPKSKEDGMDVSIYQRNKGEPKEIISIDCYVNTEGKLVTSIYQEGKQAGKQIAEIITER